ncbi:MAG: ABC transporter permease [Alphaproteobacteria bacterium]|nr:ABC transporter permease [Alphaproteobacteria bacterium]
MMENLTAILPELWQATKETLTMLAIGLTLSGLFGGALGIFLFLWRREKLLYSPAAYFIVGGIVNIVRSFPFVILMIAVGPLARTLTGTTIGPVAASVPLAIAGIAYFARLVELSLSDVPKGVIEAAQALGASTRDIVFKVLLVEARSSLVLGFTSLSVSYLSYSAAAGIIGGGGIGDLAIRYGYYRFQTDVMLITVIGLVLFVQLVQASGSHISRKIDKR